MEKNYEMKKNEKGEPYVIIRSNGAGVFAGFLKQRNTTSIILNNARRLWYWKGAASLSQLALEGVKNPKECKFSVTTNNHEICNILEIIPCTVSAFKNIQNVKEWKV